MEKVSFRDGASEETNELIDFTEEIYLGENKLLSKKEFEYFDAARMSLSKSWDSLGRSVFRDKTLLKRDIFTVFHNQKNYMKFLIFSELALMKKWTAPGPGKVWMFDLYRVLSR